MPTNSQGGWSSIVIEREEEIILEDLVVLIVMTDKLIESFASPDFDVEFFVQAARGQRAVTVVQLDACDARVKQELEQIVKEANRVVLGTAQACELTTGELLGLREQLGPVRQALESVYKEEQNKLSDLKTKHSQLAQCIEASRIVRKLAKLQTDAAKLRALFPNDAAIATCTDLFSKVSMVMGSVDAQEVLDDNKELEGITMAHEDLQLIRKIYSRKFM